MIKKINGRINGKISINIKFPSPFILSRSSENAVKIVFIPIEKIMEKG